MSKSVKMESPDSVTHSSSKKIQMIARIVEEKINVIEKINNTIFENRNDENSTLIKKISTVSKEIGYKKKNYKRF